VPKTKREINQQLLQEPKFGKGLVSKSRNGKTWRPSSNAKQELNQEEIPPCIANSRQGTLSSSIIVAIS
jgi:hypothetical protein